MKKGIHNKFILVLIVPVLYILSLAISKSTTTENLSGASAATVTKVKDFLNIIFNLPSTWVPSQNWVERNLPVYKDSLHYNGIQIYDDNSSIFGYFDSSLSLSQIDNVKDLMSDVEAAGLKGIYARTKITWLAEGQRLVYEVSNSGSTTVNNGFCYQKLMSSTYTTDSGRTVLHAKAYPDSNYNNAGWLCDSIYENMQHSDFINGEDKGNWILKPMMRIDTSDFSPDDTTAVVRIDVINFNGDLIKSVRIRVRNFGNSSFDYDGSYVSNFNFLNDPGNNLEFQGRDTINGLNYGRNALWLESGKIDFKVYWFGLVDVWFDKMIVDDELGDNIFRGIHDQKIQDEVTNFSNAAYNYTFYCDEAVYSQIPCLEYISNKMHSYNDTSKLSYVISDHLNRYSMKNDSVAYAVFLTKVKPKIFFADPYLIPWEIPDNLNFPGSDQVSASEYNEMIQRIFGDKNSAIDSYEWSFIKQVDLARTNVKLHSTESKFFVIPQLFGSMQKNNSGNYVEYGLREPTNQEIQAQAMLSIAHGAEGLGWFIYQNSEWNGSCSPIPYGQLLGHDNIFNPTPSTTAGCTFYVYGLFNIDSTGRTSNLFGQNKWDYVAKMNKKILNWKSVIDKMKWDNGYSVHEDGASHGFVTDIQSIIVHSGPPTACEEDNTNYDCAEERYWEMGFFDPDFENPSVDVTDKSKYFMMVNRRCVPEIDDDGDLRQLRIKFNSSQLSGFTNWKIIELDSNKVIRTFDKDSNIFVDMGIYQPGEGKLYRIAPVMQEGGTLVADEEITPGSFDCKNDVTGDGKNVTISPNVVVNFSEGVKWNFQGGEINFGSSANNDTPSPVTFNSSGSGWKGITLNQCYNVEIGYSVFNNIKNSSTALQIIDCSEFTINHNTFNLTSLDSVIAVGVDYFMPSGLQAGGCGENCDEEMIYTNAFINNNEFNISNSKLPTLRVSAYSSYVVSLMADRNTFNSTSGNLAIFLSNVAAGNLKNNKIYNYKTGVNVLSLASYADLYNNEISVDSVGIQINNGVINLGPQTPNYTGGFNRISAGSSSGTDIKTVLGYFYTESGLNTFNINNNTTAYHFGGTYMPQEAT